MIFMKVLVFFRSKCESLIVSNISVKNKFHWNWLQGKDAKRDFYSDHIRKVDNSEMVQFTTYGKDLVILKTSKKSMFWYSKFKIHCEKEQELVQVKLYYHHFYISKDFNMVVAVKHSSRLTWY